MSEQRKLVKISVRNLVEFILCSGDICTGRGGPVDVQILQEGSNIHRKIQKQAGSNYTAEVALKYQVPIDDTLTIQVEGRADGLICDYKIPALTGGDADSFMMESYYTIDEIKSTYTDLKYIDEAIPVHTAQAKCYAYIVAKEKNLKEIGVQMTYVNIETMKIKRFNEQLQFDELEKWFLKLVDDYSLWAKWQISWNEERDISISKLQFPFDYRPNQRKLIAGVYRTIKSGKKLFIEAPTGSGKTISSIFPAVKVMGEKSADKIFYLTAKTVARAVAEETFSVLSASGLSFKFITLTAKEKICIMDKSDCNPGACPRAKGHYDRVNDAVFDLINHEVHVTRDVISTYAEKHNVCPHEMQLDVSLWMDGIVCDYNYVFDPYVYLKRFFAEGNKGEYLFLIDEAHNLVERAREMYSASLLVSQLINVKLLVKDISRKMTSRLDKCIRYMRDLQMECEGCQLIDSVSGFAIFLMRAVSEMELFLKEDINDTVYGGVFDLYLEFKRFLQTFDMMDERYVIYMENQEDTDFMLKIFCVDPSGDLSQRLNKGKSSIFFSATLLPIHYYKSLLSASGKDDYDYYIDSPFDINKKLIIVSDDVTSQYKRRNEQEFIKISEYIKQIVRGRNGNYFVFFPSYQLMEQVYETFTEREMMKAGHGLVIHMQTRDMTEADRESFLEQFKEKPNTTTIGFCVMGGVFSEGIDLKEDRLIGAVIIGTGLPQISNERDILKNYFDRTGGMGFDYAYLYPGMNKVLQAGGRVIRTENDQGVIALLDERFHYRQYRDLFPREWMNYKRVNIRNVTEAIDSFWEQSTEEEEAQ